LGAWASAIFIVRAPQLHSTSWAQWWLAGLIAYLVHLWFGFGIIFEWSLSAVFESQTTIVAAANFGLLALWILSAALALLRRGSIWIHIATTGLFAATTLFSTLPRLGTPAFAGGVLIVILWLAAIYYRIALKRREQS
jgi:hypothetical protein